MFYETFHEKIQLFPDGEMTKLPTKTVGFSIFLVFGPPKFNFMKSRGMGIPPESKGEILGIYSGLTGIKMILRKLECLSVALFGL